MRTICGLEVSSWLILAGLFTGVVLGVIGCQGLAEEMEAYEEVKATLPVKPPSFKPPILCVGGVQYYRLPTPINNDIKGMAPVIDKDTLTFVRCE